MIEGKELEYLKCKKESRSTLLTRITY